MYITNQDFMMHLDLLTCNDCDYTLRNNKLKPKIKTTKCGHDIKTYGYRRFGSRDLQYNGMTQNKDFVIEHANFDNDDKDGLIVTNDTYMPTDQSPVKQQIPITYENDQPPSVQMESQPSPVQIQTVGRSQPSSIQMKEQQDQKNKDKIDIAIISRQKSIEQQNANVNSLSSFCVSYCCVMLLFFVLGRFEYLSNKDSTIRGLGIVLLSLALCNPMCYLCIELLNIVGNWLP